jgi:hypothetical protein
MPSLTVITGIGRCGTSVIAEFYARMGMNIGDVSWDKKRRAGNEDRNTLAINFNILRHRFSMRKKIKYLVRDVVKDPQFVASPEIIEQWWSVRQNIKILYMNRDYNAIIESQRKHPTMTCFAYRCFADLMEEREQLFRDKVKELGIPFAELTFPDCLRDFSNTFPVLQSVTSTKLDKSKAMGVWKELIDKNLIRE